MLNNFYSGYGYSKNTAGKGALEIESTYFSMLGLTQPQPFCHVFEKLGATKDGLMDRFLTLSAPAYVDSSLDSITWPQSVLNRPKDWPLLALSFIYEEHSLNGVIQYTSSEDALDELKALRNIEREETVTKFKEAEQAILEENDPVQSTLISEDNASSKDIDNGLRLSVLIHVLKYALLKALRLHDTTIPTVISRETLLRAFELTATLKKQTVSNKIAVFNDDGKLPTLEESRHGIMFEKQTPDLQSLILEYPGRFVTARMLTRRKRMPALMCAASMVKLGSVASTDPEYFGYYKQLKISGKATHCFVKAKPDEINEAILGKLQLTRDMYKDIYNKDISQTPPNTGICPDWPKYYADVRAALLGDEDEEEL